MTNFLVYGTTGYTGALITKQALAQGLRPIIAGRNATKLAAQAEAWGVDYRTFNLDDTQAIDEALTDITVVLNTAGPFARTAQPLAEGCIRTGTHYLDIAGEVPEFEAMKQYDEKATSAGVMLMPGVGFGVVPTDCLALHLKQRLPDATHLNLAFEAVGGVSQGTAQTLFKDLHKIGAIRKNGVFEPAQPAERQRTIDLGNGPTKAVTNPWRGDVSTALYSTGIPNIEAFTVFPAPVPGLMRSSNYLGWLWNSGPFQSLLHMLLKRLPVGPSDEALANGLTRVWGEVSNSQGQTAIARLSGPEAYLFTAYTALTVIQHILDGEVAIGFQTPAQAYGVDLVLGIEGVMLVDV